MRNRDLHDALRTFALEAAAALREEQAAGAEIEFDLEEGSSRGGPSLYHYRPLTQKFIEGRWSRLRFLESAGAAAEALDAGASAYLRLNGLRGAEAEPALKALLERIYDGLTDFAFPEERFERVYAEVEGTLYERSQAATILVPVHGLEMAADRVELAGGIRLVRGDRTDAPDEAVWGDPADPGDERPDQRPNALLVLERDVAPDDPLPLEDARRDFRRLLHGLRLWKPGGVTLAAVAWRRTGDGRWQPFELQSTGEARGVPWLLVEGEEAPLAEFLGAVADPPTRGPVAWALSRFQMGCGRRLEAEALTDYLLAFRALLDDGESGLALRVAVLCAEESERRLVQRRIELAQALERFVIGDGADGDYLDEVGPDSPRTLVEEVERHLRALLRDVLCGYLAPDLRRVADEMLLDQPEPFEIRAASLKVEPAPTPAEPASVPAEPAPERFRREEDDAPLEGQLGLDDAEYWSAPV
jgi:hypothetical protein